MKDDLELLRTEDAARYIGVSASTLKKLRMRGDGPDFLKLGARIVLYHTNDIENWLRTCRRTSKSSAFRK